MAGWVASEYRVYDAMFRLIECVLFSVGRLIFVRTHYITNNEMQQQTMPTCLDMLKHCYMLLGPFRSTKHLGNHTSRIYGGPYEFVVWIR